MRATREYSFWDQERRTMKAVKKRLVQAALGTAMAIGFVAVGTPAHAATSTCTIWLLTGRSCTTGSVNSHTYGHYVKWLVNTAACGAHWEVFDSNNGVRVGEGYVPYESEGSGFIYGLYSRYHLRVTNSCYATYGRISNGGQ
jgi:hypothetical protein